MRDFPRAVWIVFAAVACAPVTPHCTEIADRRALSEAEFIPLRREACRAVVEKDEPAFYAAYVKMFEKSAQMLRDFPPRQTCQTASGDAQTYDLPNREFAEKHVQMGPEKSFEQLRSQLVAGCV